MNNTSMVKVSARDAGFDADTEIVERQAISAELEALDKQTESEGKKSVGMYELVRRYASFSDLLRYAGGVSVAVAMAMFLIDGAAHFTDLQRFLTMLGFTGLLTAAGFTMSLLLKEQRGSRAFMMLSLLSVPVNFAVFGALFYSFAPIDAMAQNYPAFAHWQASSTDVLISLLAGMAVLVPVAWMSYTVLARTERSWLTTGLLFSSAVLVIPLRAELIISVLAVLSAVALSWFVRRNSGESLALKTTDGRFSIALLFVPPVILIARGLVLYNTSNVMVLMLSAGAYLLVRQLIATQKTSNFLTGLGTLVAACSAIIASSAGTDAIGGLIGSDLAVVLGICCFLLLNKDILQCSPNAKLANTVGLVSVMLSVLVLTVLSLQNVSALVTVLCIATLLVIVVYGYLRGFNPVVVTALLGIAVISVTHIEAMWDSVMQTGWWGTAVVGAVAIVVGSLLDRAGTVVVKKPDPVANLEPSAGPGSSARSESSAGLKPAAG